MNFCLYEMKSDYIFRISSRFKSILLNTVLNDLAVTLQTLRFSPIFQA